MGPRRLVNNASALPETLEDRFLDLSERLQAAPAAGKDASLVDFLARQGVLTHFYLNEQARSRLLPEGRDSSGFEQARDYAVRTAGFSFHASISLQKLLDRFEKEKVRALTFKGVVLSQLLYGQVTTRAFGDIDLLVAPEDMPRVQAIFSDMGFERGYPSGLSPAQDKALVKFSKAMNFTQAGSGLSVDLHWRLISQWLAFELPFEDLWERRQMVEARGFGAWPTLGPEDQVLFLALHGAQDGWTKLKTLLDLAYFLSRYQVDWEKVCRLSGPRLAVLSQGIGLASSLLGAPHPPSLKPYFSDPKEAFEFLRRSLEAKEPPHHRLLLPHLWSCSTPEALARSLWAILIPAVDDIRSVDLPARLINCYVLVRCFRILKKAVQRKRVK